MSDLHLITCEFPPAMGGVSEHSRVIAETARQAGFDVHVWTAEGGNGASGVDVRSTLEGFSPAACARTDSSLDAWPAPRRVIVQWVPHGYGRRGLNAAFCHWIMRRARAGDSIDVIVHEPFVDFFGGSWRQPAVALIQRYMTWMVIRAAARIWLTIPGWESRLRFYGGKKLRFARTLPVFGTIPVVRDPAAVDALRNRLLKGRSRLVGYFGAGGRYAFEALRTAAGEVAKHDTAVVCIGRGTDVLSNTLQPAIGASVALTGTGPLERGQLSLHLQACDALLQPYPDGVSGRRTTTISALEHGVPVATTIGWLSEGFWTETSAVETVAGHIPSLLGAAVLRLLETERNKAARTAAVDLYRARFDPRRTLQALLNPAPDVAIERCA